MTDPRLGPDMVLETDDQHLDSYVTRGIYRSEYLAAWCMVMTTTPRQQWCCCTQCVDVSMYSAAVRTVTGSKQSAMVRLVEPEIPSL